ncbi:MAG: SusC/RagA family TonB-linked outer membrane protein [Bacteroidales bacterium]|nr:SusC/RagA family TonB-linked outer membrane protein [Bacteroidales bacterium]
MKQLLSCVVMLVLSIVNVCAQSRTVVGQVFSNEDNEPVIGASVMIPGTDVGTITDIDGNFSLNVAEDAKTLTFSYVGMTTVTLPIKNNMHVVLEVNNMVLEDVVVTAQGLTRKEKSIGYAAQKLSAKDLTATRQVDLANSMAGKVPGARFLGGSGATFDVGTVVLRGTNDFNNPVGSEPIYVVDGVVTNKNAVNMDDVETLTVLKGSAATALYGSQGGNGAIIITTKRAEKGRGRIELSHTVKWETFYDHLSIQHKYGGGSYGLYGERFAVEGKDNMSWQGLEYINDNVVAFGLEKNADGSYIYDMSSDESWGARFDKNVKVANAWYYDATSSKYGKADPWTGNMDLSDLFRTGLSNISNIAVSKSGEDYNARISFTNQQREGILYNSDAVRRYFSVRTQYDVTSWLTVSADYKFTYHKNHNAAGEGYSKADNIFCDFVQWGQTNINIADLKDYKRADGTWRTWNPVSTTDLRANFHDNPFGIMYEMNRYHNSWGNIFSGDAELKLPYKFKAGFKLMADTRNNERENKYAEGAKNVSPSNYDLAKYHVTDITAQGRLTWGDRFMDNRLSVDAAAFVEERTYHYSYIYSSTSKGLVNGTGWWNIRNSSDYVSSTNTRRNFQTQSAYATATLGLDDTYFLDGSVRNDWDSRLGDDNSYIYGGVSASVMLDKFVHPEWLNYWKVRASMAQVGSTLSPYELDDPYYSTKYGEKTAFYHSSVQVNKDIEPTLTTSFEAGTAFRLFEDKLWGDINWYIKDTKNQIFELDVPGASGYSSRRINCGLIRNQGIEISLGTNLFRNRDWKWDFDFNIARNNNELVELCDYMHETTLTYNRFYYNWNFKAIEGKPVGVITTSNRWARNDEGELLLQPTTSNMWGDGYMPVYKDNAEKEVGNFQPDWAGGFSTSLQWKQLTLNVNFDYMIGGQMVSWTNMWGSGSGLLSRTAGNNSNGVNVREAICNGGGVDVHGVDATTGAPVDCKMNAYYYYHYQANYDNDQWVYDRTYLKLRDVSLNYSFDRKQLERLNIGLSDASVSFVASNLWLIYSACPNIDPSEMNVSSSDRLTTAFIEGGQAPSTRSFGLTVKLGF